jgi:hypothetical protein
MNEHDQRVDSVATEIGRYLRAHPDAADSAEGVRQWWLRDNATVALDLVAAALEKLTADGALRIRLLADGTRIYGAKHHGPCERSTDATP